MEPLHMQNDTMILTQDDLKKETIKRKNHIILKKLSEITPKPIDWLWPNQIAKGKVTIISGDPGLGKSQLTAYFAATVSNGLVWPKSQTNCQIGKAIFLSAEDDVEDTIHPRLEAAGADLNNIYTISAVQDKQNKNLRFFNLSSDIDILKDTINELNNDVSLIVIDPITAYLGNADSYKTSDVRGILAPLSKLAADANIAIVCISHLNKNKSQNAISRTTGSGAFVAAARAAYIVCKNPNDECQRLLLPVKNNIANDQLKFAFSITPVVLTNGISTSKIEWLDTEINITADEALNISAENESQSALDEAMDFLCDNLSQDPIVTKQLQSLADDACLSWRTIRRAKDKLGIIKAVKLNNGRWAWKLTTQDDHNN